MSFLRKILGAAGIAIALICLAYVMLFDNAPE